MDILKKFETIMNSALPKDKGLRIVIHSFPTGAEVRIYKDDEFQDAFWYSTMDMINLVVTNERANG